MWTTSQSVRRVDPRNAARRIAQVLFLLAWLRAGGAAAQSPTPLDLVWSAPPGCSSADDLRARVRKLIGEREVTGTSLRAEATVTRSGQGSLHLRLIVRVGDLVGERNLDGKSCQDLAGSAAIALALLLRSDAPLSDERSSAAVMPSQNEQRAADGRASEGSSVAVVVPAASPPLERASAELAPSPSTARRIQGLVRAPIGLFGYGPLRRPSFGLALAVGVAVARWSVEGEGRLWWPSEATSARQAERYGARIDRYTAGVRTCRALAGTRLELAPCLALSVEHIAARGTGAHISEREARATWLAAGLAAHARLHVLRWLRLVGGLELQLQTARPTLVIEGVGQIAKLLPVTFTVSFGPEWIL